MFDAYFELLYRYAYRFVGSPDAVEDLVHDLFLRVWRDREHIGTECDVRTYLYATARDVALVRLSLLQIDGGDYDGALQSLEVDAALQRASDELPRRQREVLTLRWRRRVSYDEIGEALGISAKTDASHLSRALGHLRRGLPDKIE